MIIFFIVLLISLIVEIGYPLNIGFFFSGVRFSDELSMHGRGG